MTDEKDETPEERQERELRESIAGFATKHANGVTTLRLEEPIGTTDSPIEELSVKPVRAKQLRQLDPGGNQVDQVLTFAEDLCEITRNQVDALSVADATRLTAVISLDFGGGPVPGSR